MKRIGESNVYVLSGYKQPNRFFQLLSNGEISEIDAVWFVPVNQVLCSETRFEFNGLEYFTKRNTSGYRFEMIVAETGLSYKALIDVVDDSDYTESIPSFTYEEWQSYTEDTGHYIATEKRNFYMVLCDKAWNRQEFVKVYHSTPEIPRYMPKDERPNPIIYVRCIDEGYNFGRIIKLPSKDCIIDDTTKILTCKHPYWDVFNAIKY